MIELIEFFCNGAKLDLRSYPYLFIRFKSRADELLRQIVLSAFAEVEHSSIAVARLHHISRSVSVFAVAIVQCGSCRIALSSISLLILPAKITIGCC